MATKKEIQDQIQSDISSKILPNSISPESLGGVLSGMTNITGTTYVDGGTDISVTGEGNVSNPFIVNYTGSSITLSGGTGINVSGSSPTVISLTGGTGDVTKVSLSAAQIKSLGTTPIDAIPAPGVGKYIKVTSAEAWLTWGSVAFDPNNIYIRTDGAISAQYLIGASFGGFQILDKVSNTNQYATRESSTFDVFISNTKVVIDGVDSVSTGDSTVDVYITYEIITL